MTFKQKGRRIRESITSLFGRRRRLIQSDDDVIREDMKSGSDGDDSNTGIGEDRPKCHLNEDRLGYADFARMVARSIVHMRASDGLVMAIHGPWGSGKTSAVNMVSDAIEELQADSNDRNKVIVVRFNPWWFSEQQDLALSFFTELSAALGDKVSKRVRDKLGVLARRASSSKDLVMAALAFVPGGDLTKHAGSEFLKLLGERFAGQRSLDDVRNDLQNELRQEGRRILVIIDDVDRLPVDEFRQIFRLVKSVADLPGVIHLLVFDREVANKALADLNPQGGPEWLEKIIQANFDLPPVHPHDLRQLFVEGLQQILGDIDIGDAKRWGNVFHDAIAPWLRTPRDVVRLLNAIRVSWVAIKGEVNVPDFLAIERIRVFEPKLYYFIRTNAERLTGVNDMGGYAQDNSIGEEILSVTEDIGRGRVSIALKRIFPRLESVWGNLYYDISRIEDWERERRICAPRQFSSYFSFGITENVVRLEELEAFVAILSDKDAVWTKVEEFASQRRRDGGTRAAVLLHDLQLASDDLTNDVVRRAAIALLYAGEPFLNRRDDGTGSFGFPVIWRLSFFIERLLARLELNEREELLQEAVTHSPSLVVVSYMIVSATPIPSCHF